MHVCTCNIGYENDINLLLLPDVLVFIFAVVL